MSERRPPIREEDLLTSYPTPINSRPSSYLLHRLGDAVQQTVLGFIVVNVQRHLSQVKKKVTP